jgi:putative zinc finger/helix-turn-helix YgiT family protein
MFNYKCDDCCIGTVKDVERKNFEVKIFDENFIIPKAIIGVCDHCGAINYAGEEIHRWEEFYKSWQVKSGKYISPSQIKQIRKHLSLNQSQFADFLGISRQALSAWENEKRAQVQPMNVEIILRILLSEMNQMDRSFTDKLMREYQRRFQPLTSLQIPAVMDRDAILKKILPVSTYHILEKKAGQNNTTPFTEIVRLAETCYETDQVSHFIMENIQKSQQPASELSKVRTQVSDAAGSYNIDKSRGTIYGRQ